MFKEMQSSIDRMFTPNPATLEKIRNTQIEGAQARQDEVNAQQTTEEQRRLKALRDAEEQRRKSLLELSGVLQGLPGGGSPPVTGSGGTAFFGTGGAPAAVSPDTLDGLRAGASSGFDTRGPLHVLELPKAPPPVPTPTPVVPEERPVPPERVTPELRALIDQREALRGAKTEIEGKLAQFSAKGTLTPTESATLKNLRSDLEATLNQMNYLTFTVNQALPEAMPTAAAGGGRQ